MLNRRPIPEVTPESTAFWTGGRDGEFLILRCQDCGFWVHPPGPICPSCLSTKVLPEPVSGRATVLTYTVNHHAWVPGLEVPYVIAVVGLPEQEGLQMTTNIVGCPVDDVRIGMPVRVCFEPLGDVVLPLFEPGEP